MQIGILAHPDSWYYRDLQRAAAEVPECRSTIAISFTSLAATLDSDSRISSNEQEDLSDLDVVLVRTMPAGSLEQIIFRMNALHQLSQLGTDVVNPPRCLEVAVDKYLALAQMQAAGLPVPRTRTSQQWEQAMDDFSALGSDVVVKPVFGSEGRGIVRITDEEHAWRLFKSLSQLGHVIYQQEYIDHGGRDQRVLVVGKQMYAVCRVNRQDWRTNVRLGARTEPVTVTDELREMAQQAVQVTGARMLAVDFVADADGHNYLLEVNAVPGWKSLSRTLQVDVAKQVIQSLWSAGTGG